jgi:hypothetical protein
MEYPGSRCGRTGLVAEYRSAMRAYTFKQKVKITAGAVAALVIVGWVVALAIAFLSVP